MASVGVIGGGQLARMMTPPAINLGIQIKVLAEAEGASAQLATSMVGDYNQLDVVREFAGLGDIVIMEDETKIRILSITSAVMSTYFTIQNTVMKWTEDNGIDHDTASQYVRSLLEGLAIEGQAATDAEIPHLPVEHETPGGLNYRNRTGLEQDGWFDALYNRLQDTYSNANLKAKSSE